MTKADYISKIAEATGYTKKDVAEVLNAERDIVWCALRDKDEVRVFDGIILRTQFKDAHEGRNPSTGETIQIPAKYSPKAKFGVAIKRFINE